MFSQDKDANNVTSANKTKQEKKSPKYENPCGICRANGIPMPCRGHGGGGGGSGGGSSSGGSSSDTTNQRDTNSSTTNTNYQQQQSAAVALTDLTSAIDNPLFKPEIISDLLANQLLRIDNNIESGILNIELRCQPSELSAEQRQALNIYVLLVLKELAVFKQENGLTTDCHVAQYDQAGHVSSLRITLPKPIYYDAFVKRLADHELLPVNNVMPASTATTPVTQAEKSPEKSSAIRPKSPLDGLKPKDWI